MTWAPKKGRIYHGRKDATLTRKVTALEYDEWFNWYWIHYTDQRGREGRCSDINFRAWAAKP